MFLLKISFSPKASLEVGFSLRFQSGGWTRTGVTERAGEGVWTERAGELA